MSNIKFSDFTFEAPNGTAQLVGYRSTVNFRTDTTSLASGLGVDAFVDLESEQEVSGSKLFTSTLMLGESSASSMSSITLYSKSSNDSYWVINSRLDDTEKSLLFKSNNLSRWAFTVDGIAQDLSLNFYNDAGALLSSALYLNRSNGQVYIPQSLRLDGQLRVGNNSVVLSNAELQRLDGVSSNIQTQISGKQNSISTDGDTTKILDGTISFRLITTSDVPSLDASKITSGVFDKTLIPKKIIAGVKTNASTSSTTATEAVITSISLPSGSLSIGDVIKLNFSYSLTSGNTKTARVRVASTAGTAGSIIGYASTLSSSVLNLQAEGVFVITSNTTMRFASMQNPSYGSNTSSATTVTIPNITSSAMVFSFNGNATVSQQFIVEYAYVEIIKP